MAGEVWALRNKRQARMGAEEGASIRAIRRIYAQEAGIPIGEAPDPRVIEKIALGNTNGDRAAAIESYRRFGEVVGDAMGNALTLIDGLAVIGGGLSNGHQLFLPAVIDELNSTYLGSNGCQLRRLTPIAFNLEDSAQMKKFLVGEHQEISVPGSNRKIKYDSLQRIGVGISRLGTGEAVAIGAYAMALQKLDQ
jgi:glucokinase